MRWCSKDKYVTLIEPVGTERHNKIKGVNQENKLCDLVR